MYSKNQIFMSGDDEDGSGGVKVIYNDLSVCGTLGFYRVLPGKQPYICLDITLQSEGKEDLRQTVFNRLFEFHQSIPADSIYRLFPLRKYQEDLLPVQEVQVFLIGRAMRRWRFSFPGERARVIGKAG